METYEDYVVQIEPDSEVEDTWINILTSHTLFKETALDYEVMEVKTVENPRLRARFEEKRSDFHNLGYDSNETKSCYGFAIEPEHKLLGIVSQGPMNRPGAFHLLGYNECGFRLWTHADVCMKLATLQHKHTCRMVIYKFMYGRVKHVIVNQYRDALSLLPTEGYDCHMSAITATKDSTLNENINYSQAYLYNLDPVTSDKLQPTQVYPIAVLSLIQSSVVEQFKEEELAAKLPDSESESDMDPQQKSLFQTGEIFEFEADFRIERPVNSYLSTVIEAPLPGSFQKLMDILQSAPLSDRFEINNNDLKLCEVDDDDREKLVRDLSKEVERMRPRIRFSKGGRGYTDLSHDFKWIELKQNAGEKKIDRKQKNQNGKSESLKIGENKTALNNKNLGNVDAKSKSNIFGNNNSISDISVKLGCTKLSSFGNKQQREVTGNISKTFHSKLPMSYGGGSQVSAGGVTMNHVQENTKNTDEKRIVESRNTSHGNRIVEFRNTSHGNQVNSQGISVDVTLNNTVAASILSSTATSTGVKSIDTCDSVSPTSVGSFLSPIVEEVKAALASLGVMQDNINYASKNVLTTENDLDKMPPPPANMCASISTLSRSSSVTSALADNSDTLHEKPSFHGKTLLKGKNVPARNIPLEQLYLIKPFRSNGLPTQRPVDPRGNDYIEKDHDVELIPLNFFDMNQNALEEVQVLLDKLHTIEDLTKNLKRHKNSNFDVNAPVSKSTTNRGKSEDTDQEKVSNIRDSLKRQFKEQMYSNSLVANEPVIIHTGNMNSLEENPPLDSNDSDSDSAVARKIRDNIERNRYITINTSNNASSDNEHCLKKDQNSGKSAPKAIITSSPTSEEMSVKEQHDLLEEMYVVNKSKIEEPRFGNQEKPYPLEDIYSPLKMEMCREDQDLIIVGDFSKDCDKHQPYNIVPGMIMKDQQSCSEEGKKSIIQSNSIPVLVGVNRSKQETEEGINMTESSSDERYIKFKNENVKSNCNIIIDLHSDLNENKFISRSVIDLCHEDNDELILKLQEENVLFEDKTGLNSNDNNSNGVKDLCQGGKDKVILELQDEDQKCKPKPEDREEHCVSSLFSRNAEYEENSKEYSSRTLYNNESRSPSPQSNDRYRKEYNSRTRYNNESRSPSPQSNDRYRKEYNSRTRYNNESRSPSPQSNDRYSKEYNSRRRYNNESRSPSPQSNDRYRKEYNSRTRYNNESRSPSPESNDRYSKEYNSRTRYNNESRSPSPQSNDRYRQEYSSRTRYNNESRSPSPQSNDRYNHAKAHSGIYDDYSRSPSPKSRKSYNRSKSPASWNKSNSNYLIDRHDNYNSRSRSPRISGNKSRSPSPQNKHCYTHSESKPHFDDYSVDGNDNYGSTSISPTFFRKKYRSRSPPDYGQRSNSPLQHKFLGRSRSRSISPPRFITDYRLSKSKPCERSRSRSQSPKRLRQEYAKAKGSLQEIGSSRSRSVSPCSSQHGFSSVVSRRTNYSAYSSCSRSDKKKRKISSRKSKNTSPSKCLPKVPPKLKRKLSPIVWDEDEARSGFSQPPPAYFSAGKTTYDYYDRSRSVSLDAEPEVRNVVVLDTKLENHKSAKGSIFSENVSSYENENAVNNGCIDPVVAGNSNSGTKPSVFNRLGFNSLFPKQSKCSVYEESNCEVARDVTDRSNLCWSSVNHNENSNSSNGSSSRLSAFSRLGTVNDGSNIRFMEKRGNDIAELWEDNMTDSRKNSTKEEKRYTVDYSDIDFK